MNKIRYLSLLMLLFSSILLGGKGSSALASPNQRLLEGETLLTVAADPPEGGSVSGGGSYVAGTQVNLRASANTGFQFINWTLDGKVISTENNFTYTKGEVDETLVAHFVYNPGSPSEPSEPVTLSKLIVVANPSDGGSVSGGGNYAKDQKVDLRANPNTGFQFINWTLDGVEVSKERNFTYTKGEDNETLTANFEYKPGNPNEPDEPDIKPIKKKYKLTVVSEEGGTNVSGSGEYESGTQVELYVYVTTGFTFTGWYNEADSLLSSETRFKYTTQERAEILTARFKYTPNNPAEPDEPNLPPKPVSHKITVNAMPSDGGSVSVEKETVNEGEQTRVRASANTGFVFQGWYVADTLFQTAADFYYTMEKKDISMEARFNYSPSAPDEPGEASKKSYTLYLTSVRGLPGRTVQYPVYLSSLDSLTNIQFNISFPIGLTPDIDNIKLSGKAQGYTLSCEEIEVTNDESQIASRRAADKETAYQFTMTDGKLPACNTRLMVIDVKIDETASDTTQQVKINQVTVTDTEGTNTTASTRNGNVVMKESSGDGNYYYLTAISTGSGQVTVNSRTVRNSLHIFDLLEGSSTNVYFTPDNGYHIDKVLLNEEDITEQVVENGRYLFSNVNADATLTVMFAEGASDAYDLTVKAVGNGVVTYNGISIRDSEQMMSVSHGAQVELSITPDEHWHVGQVILNDTTDVTSSIADGKYVIESMTSAISISVTFMEDLVVATPVIVRNGNKIGISTATEEATIYYTLDGTTPDSTSTVYTDSILVDRNCTIKAIALRENYNPSEVVELVVDWFKVANVEFVQEGNHLFLSTATEQAIIYYTISNGIEKEQVYSEALTLTEDCVIEAWAVRDGYATSDTTNYEFHAEILTVATPVIVRNGNKIGISTATEEATIYYTLDGTTPDSSSMVYTDSILVDRNCTIKAIALRENYNPSEVTELVVDWFKVANVEFVQEGNHLFLSTATEQAIIYYTISNGIEKEQVYSEALTLTEDCVIEAWAVRDGYTTSDTTSYEFHYTPSDIATFDGLVATVSGERTLDDAFESVGGRSIAAKTIAAIVWDKTTKMTDQDLQGLYNPNMLIYISNDSLAPPEYENVVVNGYAKNIVLKDVSSGNNNFYCPKEFTVEKISYTRNFRQQTEIGICRGWESIALPFTVQSITNERNGVIAPFGNNDSKKHFWLRKLSENGLIQATQVEANQPYLISMPNNEKAYPTEYNQYGEVTFTSENVVVPVTELSMIETQNENDEILMLCPTMQLVTPSLHVYALNVGEQRGSYLEGSVFEQEYREVRPFEAYTIHHGNSSAPKYLPINDMLGKGSTDINDIIVKKDHLTDDWYSLDGRKLQGRPTQKGLYILNGRKMVVK